TALSQDAAPFAIRYPRDTVPAGYDPAVPPKTLPIGSWEILERGEDASLIAVGAMVEVARGAREILARAGVSAGIVNARFVKPVDGDVLAEVSRAARLLVTIEESALAGGFGAGVVEALGDAGLSRDGVVAIGLPDAFVTHGTRAELLAEVGLDAAGVAARVLAALDRKR
ncbi:MAG TPA: transketolase C-terminal domain-containing protein, partial [Candidatus Sulfotelmatobacter sp.]|nr:transketolase C-terminal domain-containing protein [Candidatus Sulfotelmatobacter sp.]